jgi:hypothetical protein
MEHWRTRIVATPPISRSIEVFVRSFWWSFTLVLLAPTAVRAGDDALPLAVAHEPVACVIAEQYPQLEARVEPPTVVRVRVHFRPEKGRHWYSVPMEAAEGRMTAVLPKPRRKLKALEYYIEAIDSALQTVRTPEQRVVVDGTAFACRNSVVAATLSSAVVAIIAPAGAPLVPAGFAASGVVASGATVGTAAAGAGGGMSGTALAVGGLLVAGGAAVAVAASGAEDTAPPAATMTVGPSGGAVLGITQMQFGVMGTVADPSWDFGDGNTASGSAATHVFAQEGDFTVTLRSGGRNVDSRTVSVRSLTGTWSFVQPNVTFTLVMVQQGSGLTGRWLVGAGSATAEFQSADSPLQGTVSPPRNVTIRQLGECGRTEVGVVDGDLRVLTNVVQAATNSLCVTNSTHRYVRQ